MNGPPSSQPTTTEPISRAAIPTKLMGRMCSNVWNRTTRMNPNATKLRTALSLVAQYALTRKWLENWWIWISANLIYLGLFLVNQAYWVAALQVAFIALSVSGWARWRADIRSRQASAATSAGG